MTTAVTPLPVLQELPVAFDRDSFLLNLLRELTGTLQEIVGLEEASGFISLVGQRIGDQINATYREAFQVPSLNREQVVQVLVDLKRRIQGEFHVIEETEDRIVLGNRRCPFADRVTDRPSLCMMTSTVFGVVVAENLGYARVDVTRAIARGDTNCQIVIYLRPSQDNSIQGKEYYKA